MDCKKLIDKLDTADLYLRDRMQTKSVPLNEWDVDIMLDIADTCDKAARFIENLQKTSTVKERQ